MPPDAGAQPQPESVPEDRSTTRDVIARAIEEYVTTVYGSDATQPTIRFLEEHPELLDDLSHKLGPGLGRLPVIPDRIGAWELGKTLGAGGMGTVVLGRHDRTGIKAAIKLVPLENVALVEHLEAEAAAYATIHQPNIVKILDRGRDRGFAWMAVEYVEGRTLSQFLRSRDDETLMTEYYFEGEDLERVSQIISPVSPVTEGATGKAQDVRLAIAWFRDLALALHAIHEAGLIHRDVKPANIMIAADGTPYLIDFGLVKEYGPDMDLRISLEGSVPYMSPEQALGGRVDLTPRTDQYSLSVTFFEVLCGQRQAAEGGRRDILKDIALGDPKPPSRFDSRVPRSLDGIFMRALAKNPERRYASCQDLAEDLASWLGGRPLPHVRETLVRRGSRFARRHPGAAACLFLVLLLGLASGIQALFFSGYGEIAARVSKAEAAGNYDRVLQLIDALPLEARSEPPFKEAGLKALMQVLPRQVREAMSGLTFVMASFLKDSQIDRLATDARRRLKTHDLTGLVFLVALRDLLADEPAAGLRTIREHSSASGDRLMLMDLEILCLLEQLAQNETGVVPEAPSPAVAVNLLALRMNAQDPAQGDTTSLNVRSLAAYRTIRWIQVLPDSVVAKRPVYERLERELSAVLKPSAGPAPDHLFARTILGLLRYSLENWSAALKTFSTLEKPGATEATDRALQAWVTLTMYRKALDTGAEQAEWIAIRQEVRRLADFDTRLLGWFSEQVTRESKLDLLRIWHERILDSDQLREVRWPTKTWRQLHWLVDELLSVNRMTEVVKLGELAEQRWSQVIPEQRKHFHHIQSYRDAVYWLAIKKKHDSSSLAPTDAGEIDEFLVLNERLLAYRKESDLQYGMLSERARALSWRERLEPGPKQKAKLRKQAILLIQRLLDEDFVADQRRLLSPAEADVQGKYLDECRDACRTELEVLRKPR